MTCYYMLHCIVDKNKDGQTPWHARFGEDFRGPTIPLGAEIEYLPISDKDKARVQPFASKLLQGIFVGYEQQAGGGCSGDLLIVNSEEVQNSEH